MKRCSLAFFAGGLLVGSAPQVLAPPPLITGDVPTAPQGGFEWYLGFRYQDTGSIERRLPHSEVVYGLTDRWELSVESPYLEHENEHGFGDLTLATKWVALTETQIRPAFGMSYEIKLDNGDAERGLGSGGYEHDLRVRAQKTLGWFTPIVNVGYVIMPDGRIGGIAQRRENVWRTSFAQEWQVAKATKLLSEIYWRTEDAAGGADRLAWNAGFKHKLRDNLTFHAAIGKTLRENNRGGPELRVYAGVKWEFEAPWKRKDHP
ncbi:MAG: transporter [Verrucomicrobiota bacterium]